MRTAITTALFITPIFSFGQLKKITTYYDYQRNKVKEVYYVNISTGLKEGAYQEHYENGVVGVSGQCKNNRQVKTWRYFTPLQNQYLEKNYNDAGQLHGNMSGCIDPNAYRCIPIKGSFVNGEKEGKWYEYYDKVGGQVKTLKTYKDGRLSGTYEEYFGNGLIAKRGKYTQEGGIRDDNAAKFNDTVFYYTASPKEPRLEKIEVYKYGLKAFEKTFETAESYSEDRQRESFAINEQKRKQLIDELYQQPNTAMDFKAFTNKKLEDYLIYYRDRTGLDEEEKLKAAKEDVLSDSMSGKIQEEYNSIIESLSQNKFNRSIEGNEREAYREALLFTEADTKYTLSVFYHLGNINGINSDYEEELLNHVNGYFSGINSWSGPIKLNDADKVRYIDFIKNHNMPKYDDDNIQFSSNFVQNFVLKNLLRLSFVGGRPDDLGLCPNKKQEEYIRSVIKVDLKKIAGDKVMDETKRKAALELEEQEKQKKNTISEMREYLNGRRMKAQKDSLDTLFPQYPEIVSAWEFMYRQFSSGVSNNYYTLSNENYSETYKNFVQYKELTKLLYDLNNCPQISKLGKMVKVVTRPESQVQTIFYFKCQ